MEISAIFHSLTHSLKKDRNPFLAFLMDHPQVAYEKGALTVKDDIKALYGENVKISTSTFLDANKEWTEVKLNRCGKKRGLGSDWSFES